MLAPLVRFLFIDNDTPKRRPLNPRLDLYLESAPGGTRVGYWYRSGAFCVPEPALLDQIFQPTLISHQNTNRRASAGELMIPTTKPDLPRVCHIVSRNKAELIDSSYNNHHINPRSINGKFKMQHMNVKT